MIIVKKVLIFQISERTKSTSPIVDKYSTIQLAEQLTFVHHTLLSIIPARYEYFHVILPVYHAFAVDSFFGADTSLTGRTKL